MLRNIVRRVRDEHRVDARARRRRTRPAARLVHARTCPTAAAASGRQLESLLVNPLARALFDREPGRDETVKIIDIARDGPVTTVVLS